MCQTGVTLLEPLLVIADDGCGDLGLLVGHRVHEVERVTVGPGILHLLGLETHVIELVVGPEGVLDDAAGGDVLELGANEGTAFARLDVLELDNGAKLVVVLDAHAVFKV